MPAAAHAAVVLSRLAEELESHERVLMEIRQSERRARPLWQRAEEQRPSRADERVNAMCGIIGIAARSGATARQWLGAGCDALRHRGPDGAGEWWSEDGRVGLAHRRLAIIDLSAAGHQPMHDSTGELCIVFNGEIYNFTDLREQLAAKGHTFRSRTDTEVILAAYRQWGAECVTRFNGMFAFALYDTRQRMLFMARDRAGEKPLFYALADGALRFASELKGLMADPAFPRRIDARGARLLSRDGIHPRRALHSSGREEAAARSCDALRREKRRNEGVALLGSASASRCRCGRSRDSKPS